MPTRYAKSLRNIVFGPVESPRPLWYAGPDLAAAVITDKARPRILRAWKLRPIGIQATLKPLDFRGEVRIDPRTGDFFRVLIEQRKRTSDNPLDDELRNTGFKVVANSGSYGDFAETNPADIDPDAEPVARPVHVYTNRVFTMSVNRPESPGRFCFFPTASLVTAAARLLLSLGFYEVARLRGEVAYCDTDSLVVVATKDGGLVQCARGEAIAEAHQRNRSWARDHPGDRDEARFKREIAPRLDAFTLKEIGKATGLSLAACSRIRAGVKVPHPRHWDALLALVGA